ncbi:hypothetical protein LEMLEM_LOCUS8453, partial [Lemmus lemmus]
VSSATGASRQTYTRVQQALHWQSQLPVSLLFLIRTSISGLYLLYKKEQLIPRSTPSESSQEMEISAHHRGLGLRKFLKEVGPAASCSCRHGFPAVMDCMGPCTVN